jgi:pyrimidine operon attenuation protein/uracil phosphoribosyltransferase
MSQKIQLLDAAQANQKLTRLAYEMYEQNLGEKEIVLAGIADRGIDLAKLLKKKIEAISELDIRLVNIYLDKANPVDARIEPAFDPTGKTIIVVDDVANSGKTMTYALKPLLDAVARKIQVAVLIDRQHKQYPVASDYVGLQLSTTIQDHITVDILKGKVSGAFIE